MSDLCVMGCCKADAPFQLLPCVDNGHLELPSIGQAQPAPCLVGTIVSMSRGIGQAPASGLIYDTKLLIAKLNRPTIFYR